MQQKAGEDVQDQSIRPIKIFYCYAHEDDALREQLARHLIPLRRLRDITGWFDRDIQAGVEWERESEEQLDTASIILLLVSADFMASDYCYTVEMTRALERHKAGSAHVIPILLRPVEWEKTPLGTLSPLPTNRMPVTLWSNQDAAWLNIVQGINDIIRKLLPKQLLSLQDADILYSSQGPLSGQIVGEKYILGELLGEGGFGVVYKARHLHLQRLQAVKILLERHFQKSAFRERFLREAQTVAALDHPNIIHLDDFGVEPARAYLVMPLIKGGTLQHILQKQPSPLRPEQVVLYIEHICLALDYAHAHGVVHLDLKPLNLLARDDGGLLLADFGLAHLMKQGTVEGGSSLLFGSPHYMAPEHIQGQPEQRSDLFSLGVILYQVLVGRLPFEGSTPEAVLRKNLTEWPAAPRAIRPELPQGVEDVIGKALAKQPVSRYQTASELLAAFKHALNISAQPQFPLNAAKIAPMKPAPLSPSPTKFAPGTPLLKYEHSSHAAWMIAWSPNWKRLASGGDDAAVRIWDATTGKALLVLLGHSERVTAVAWSPDGLQLASSSDDHTVRVWEATSGRQLLSYEYSNYVNDLAWSPDGRQIAAGTYPHSFPSPDQIVQVWEAISGRQLLRYAHLEGGVQAIAWSPNGRLIASGGGLTVQVWEASSGKLLLRYRTSSVESIAWSPDSRLLASSSDNRIVQVWDVISGKQLQRYESHPKRVTTVAWSPDGLRLASGSDDCTVQVWEATSGRLLQNYGGHSKSVHSVVWSSDRLRLASSGWDKTVQVWEATSGKLLQRYEVHHADEVYTVAWSPDGRLIASGSQDKTVQVWEAASGKLLLCYTDHSTDVKTLAWSPDGRLIASGGGYTGGNDYAVQVWEAASGKLLLCYTGHSNAVSALAWSPDGQFLASGGWMDKSVQVWEPISGKLLLRYGSVSGKEKSDDGPYAAPPSGSVGAVAWSPDGRLIASAYEDRDNKSYTVQVWEAISGKLLQRYEGHTSDVSAVAWSPDNRLLASAGHWDKTIQIWEATSGKQLLRYERHSSFVNAVVWSPDGRLIASGSADKTVQVWEATSGNLLFTYWGHFTDVNSIAWSSNGEHIASAAHDVHIWQAPR